MDAGIPYLVFELGGMSLEDVVHTPSLHPLPRRHLREIAIQLLRALDCKCDIELMFRGIR